MPWLLKGGAGKGNINQFLREKFSWSFRKGNRTPVGLNIDNYNVINTSIEEEKDIVP